jgi:hypothetical protein
VSDFYGEYCEDLTNVFWAGTIKSRVNIPIMGAFKRRLKRTLGFISVAILLVGVVFGILAKEKNDQKIISGQISNYDNQAKGKNTQITQPKKICKDFLEEDENGLILKEYGKVEAVDCMSVGCGGVL